jgi:hypothetical protein
MNTKQTITRLVYCQYLLSSQINYTLTHFADHTDAFSHDAVNLYLAEDQITPRLVWENVQGDVVQREECCLVFDDTVLDRRFSQKIVLVRKQYSDNAHGVIKGTGVVTCVYVNPETDLFWIIDYRILDPDGDGKSKLDHGYDILANAVYNKQLHFRVVLMDSWYATKDLMLFIEQLKKYYYCPLKDNRQVDDSSGRVPYQRVDQLLWSSDEQEQSKAVKVKDFPAEHKVKLFRVVLST